ncbi:MAG: metallophosphoesterase [Anaerolineaceae bacterium]
MKLGNKSHQNKMLRILYGSDFHGSDVVYRKFISAAFQYQADVLIVGGDVTGKAMVPVISNGNGKYSSSLFGKNLSAGSNEELTKIKKEISSVGFYPIVLNQDEADDLESHSEKMATRFEFEMCERVRDWMRIADEKLTPDHKTLYFMAGNDDVASIDETVAEFPNIRNPDMTRFEIDGGYEILGLSASNMTPWCCARDMEEEDLQAKLDQLEGLIQTPETAITVLHVPPYNSSLDTCPELDKNLKIITRGGQVVMKSAGAKAVTNFIEKVQPLLSLHGHIHESPGHVHIGRTLAINAGSEYAEAILKAAIINLENGKVKGHMMISG